MIPIFTGIIASSLHVIAGPDHLAAVTPLAIENKEKSWKVGVSWGIGHVLGMLLIGGLFLLFKDLIPVEAISGHSEQLVGIVLVLIGLWAIYKAFKKKEGKHSHPHFHKKPLPHLHVHKHKHEDIEGEHSHDHKANPAKQNNVAAFLVGTLHGFAGISHLLLIIPTLSFPSVFDSAMYLSGFAIGTIGSMGIFALILGIISLRSSLAHNHNLFKYLRIIGGLFAIGIGIFWFFSTI